jgi:hypothetical protein
MARRRRQQSRARSRANHRTHLAPPSRTSTHPDDRPATDLPRLASRSRKGFSKVELASHPASPDRRQRSRGGNRARLAVVVAMLQSANYDVTLIPDD